MITKFKIFESSLNIEDVKNEIEYKYILHFKNEEEYNDFCMDKNNTDDLDEVDWDSVAEDIIEELGLENEYPSLNLSQLISIIVDIMCDVDLDDCDDVRGNYDVFLMKKNAEKYNL